MQHPSRGGSSPCPHTQKSRRGIKFDYPSCPFPQGRGRTRERPRWGPGLLSGDSAQKHGTATLLTHTLGSRGNSGHPNPPGGGGKGDNLHGAQFASDGAELLEKKKKKSREGPRSGASQWEVQVPSLPRPGAPGPAGTSPPSPLLLLHSASSALPPFLVAAAGAWRARRLLGARQAREQPRVEVTRPLPRRPARRRLPTRQRRPALPGAAGRASSPSGGAAAAGGGWRPARGSSRQSALRSRRRPRRRPGRRGAAGAIYLRRPPSLNWKRRRPRQRSGRPGRS